MVKFIYIKIIKNNGNFFEKISYHAIIKVVFIFIINFTNN